MSKSIFIILYFGIMCYFILLELQSFERANGVTIIKEQYRKELQAYFVGILSKLGSYTEEICAKLA